MRALLAAESVAMADGEAFHRENDFDMFRVERRGDVWVVAIVGDPLADPAGLEFEAAELRHLLAKRLSPRLVLDVTQIRYVGSSTLAALSPLLANSRSRRGHVVMVAESKDVRSVLSACGIDAGVPVYPTVREALASLGGKAHADEPSFFSWHKMALVAGPVALAVVALFFFQGDTSQQAVLAEMEEIVYRYQMLQRKKLIGQDWLDEAEPLVRDIEEVEDSLLHMTQPVPELMEAGAALGEVVRSPKRPDPRIEDVESKIRDAQVAVNSRR